MKLSKVISATADNLNRLVVKVLRLGNQDVQEAISVAPYGIDSNPIQDMIAVYSETGVKGENIIIGYVNKNQLAGVGELRQFSTDTDGIEQFYTWIRSNGTIEIGGSTKNVARYQELETAFNELNSKFNSLITIFNAHVHSGVTAGGGSSGATVTPGTSSTADITGAKINEIKCL